MSLKSNTVQMIGIGEILWMEQLVRLYRKSNLYSEVLVEWVCLFTSEERTVVLIRQTFWAFPVSWSATGDRRWWWRPRWLTWSWRGCGWTASCLSCTWTDPRSSLVWWSWVRSRPDVWSPQSLDSRCREIGTGTQSRGRESGSCWTRISQFPAKYDANRETVSAKVVEKVGHLYITCHSYSALT